MCVLFCRTNVLKGSMKLHVVSCFDSCKEEVVFRLFTRIHTEVPLYLCQTHFDLINKVYDLEKIGPCTYRRTYWEDDCDAQRSHTTNSL